LAPLPPLDGEGADPGPDPGEAGGVKITPNNDDQAKRVPALAYEWSIALTISSVIFLASPSSIIVPSL
jgi:hypothetical protein